MYISIKKDILRLKMVGTTNNQQLQQSIVKQGASQKINNNSSANNELTISVSVGKIDISY